MPHVLGLGTPGVRSFPGPPGLSLGRALGDQGLSGEPGAPSPLCALGKARQRKAEAGTQAGGL